MKVRVQPADHGGCGFYRLRWPCAVLQRLGADIVVAEDFTDVWRPTGVGSLVNVHTDADVVVLQRPMHGNQIPMVQALQRDGVAVVVEIDDDFHSLPKGHPARRDTAAIHNERQNRTHLRKLCELADLVTVTTPALAERYGAHGRCVIVPNFVPASYLLIERTRDPARALRVGWTGSTETHVDDLRVCGRGVLGALMETDAEFHVVGTGRGVQDQLQLKAEPTATGWLEIEDYPAEYACLDVAIVPLQPNRFNEAKSALKGLEAAALGVPFVSSPTGPYASLAAEGVGVLAETPRDWQRHVSGLLGDEGARSEMAEAGREWASKQTIEGNAWRLLEAWEAALINRRGRVAA